MTIEEWFDITSIAHLKAFVQVEKTGAWPKDFIPVNVIFGNAFWRYNLRAKMADQYLKEKCQ